MGPSGGLAYHLSALRFRGSRWQPFVRSVERWLMQDWNPSASELILFGPSAGWTLTASFLARFAHVTAVEPDPLARCLLRRRFAGVLRPRTRLELVADAGILPWFSTRPETFGDFLADRPNAAVLFSNVLGQIPLLNPLWPGDASAQANGAIRAEFLRSLEKRNWASYHDLLSGQPGSGAALADERLRPHAISSESLPLEDLASTCFHPGKQVIDHDTLWLSQNRKTSLAVWDLRPGARHLIGFVTGSASSHRTPD
jgi:hypothetical protein